MIGGLLSALLALAILAMFPGWEIELNARGAQFAAAFAGLWFALNFFFVSPYYLWRRKRKLISNQREALTSQAASATNTPSGSPQNPAFTFTQMREDLADQVVVQLRCENNGGPCRVKAKCKLSDIDGTVVSTHLVTDFYGCWKGQTEPEFELLHGDYGDLIIGITRTEDQGVIIPVAHNEEANKFHRIAANNRSLSYTMQVAVVADPQTLDGPHRFSIPIRIDWPSASRSIPNVTFSATGLARTKRK